MYCLWVLFNGVVEVGIGEGEFLEFVVVEWVVDCFFVGGSVDGDGLCGG